MKVGSARERLFGAQLVEQPLRERAEELRREKFPRPNNWSGDDLRKRAQECKLEKLYDAMYAEACRYAHLDSSTWQDVADNGGGFRLGPNTELVPDAL